jgi:hypothetical protein
MSKNIVIDSTTAAHNIATMFATEYIRNKNFHIYSGNNEFKEQATKVSQIYAIAYEEAYKALKIENDFNIESLL